VASAYVPVLTLASLWRAPGALRDVGKALSLPEDLIKMLSSQIWECFPARFSVVIREIADPFWPRMESVLMPVSH
jgi:DNA polymerase III alpha subunit